MMHSSFVYISPNTELIIVAVRIGLTELSSEAVAAVASIDSVLQSNWLLHVLFYFLEQISVDWLSNVGVAREVADYVANMIWRSWIS